MGKSGYLLRRIRARVANRPTGFIWVKPSQLAASGYPSSKKQIIWARGQGVARILTLTEAPLPEDWTDGVEARHVAMKDHQPPSYDALMEASSYIADSISNGRPILVHCLAGQGRTMCAIAAHLIRDGMGLGEALVYLRGLRPGAVERSQESALREFASRIARSRESDSAG